MDADFLKTDYERFQETLQARAESDFFKRAALSDPRVQMANAALSVFAAGGNAKAAKLYMSSDKGRLQQQAIATAFNTGAFGGGSAEIMARGIQQMVSGSNMRIAGSVDGVAQNGILFGSGRTANTLSEKLYNDIQGRMYSPVTGLGNINKTAGFNKSEMGEIGARLGAQGTFAGLSGGRVDMVGDKVTTTIDPTTAKYIEKKMSDTAKMLAVVKSITGSNAISQLASEAVALTGMSGHNTEAVTKSLNQLKTAAKQQGVSFEEMAQSRGANLQGLVGRGFGSAVAGGLLSATEDRVTGAVLNSKEAAARAAQRGTFVRSYTTEELRNSAIKDSSRLLMENPNLAEAGAYLSAEHMGTKETKARLEKAVSAVGNVTTDAGRSAAQSELSKAIQAHSGMAAGVLTQQIGTEGVQNSMSAAQANLVGEAANKATAGLVGGNLIANIARKAGASAEDTRASQTFFAAFDAKTKNELTDALAGGDTDKFSKIVDANKDTLLKGGIKTEDIENLKKSGAAGPAKFNQLISNVGLAGGNRLVSMTNVQTRTALAENAATEAWMANSVGNTAVNKEDFFTALQRGAFKDHPVTNGNMLNYLSGKGKVSTFDLENNAPNSAEKSKDLAKILNTYGDFNKTLGLGKDATGEEIQKAMQSPEGVNATRKFFETQKVTYTQDTKHLNVVDKAASNTAGESVQLAQEAKSLLALKGVDVSSEAGRKQVEDYVSKRVTRSGETEIATTKRIAKNTVEDAALLKEAITPEFLAKAADKTSPEFARLSEYSTNHKPMLEGAFAGATDASKGAVDKAWFFKGKEKEALANLETVKSNLLGEAKDSDPKEVNRAILRHLSSIDTSLKDRK